MPSNVPYRYCRRVCKTQGRTNRSLDGRGQEARPGTWLSALYAAADAWEAGVRLFLSTAPALLESGRRATLEWRASALPDWVRDLHPRVWFWIGRAETQVRPLDAVNTFQAAVQLLRTQGDADGVLLCLAALLGVGNLAHLGLDRAREWAGQFLALCDALSEEHLAAADPVVWLAIANVCFTHPRHRLTLAMPSLMATALERGMASHGLLGGASSAMSGATCTGQFEVSERIAAAMMPFVDAPNASPSEAAWFLYTVGYLRFLQTRYEEAHALLVRAERLAGSAGLREVLYEIALYRFMVEFRAMGWELACRSLREAETVPVQRRPMRIALLRIYQARRATWQGEPGQAADLAEASMRAIDAIGTDYHVMCFGLFSADVLIQDGRLERAAALVRRAREIVWPAQALDCWRAVLLMTETYLVLRAEGRDAAMPLLREALQAARVGMRRYFLRFQECCMPPLFSLALEADIDTELVCELIRKFRLPPPVNAPDAWPRAVRIRTLGRFDVVVNDEPLEYSRKVPKKTLALLKALVAHGAREVPEEWLCDMLWRDEEADAARQALGITVIRLRKLLGCAEAVAQQGGRVWLDRQRVWVDVWRFEQAFGDEASRVPAMLLDLYGGTFLPDDEDEPWSVAMRERLRGKFIHVLAAHAGRLEAAGDSEAAAACYLRGLDADAIVEAFHQGLMRCYRALGRPTEAIGAFRRLRQTLSVVLGVAPSAASECLYREVLAGLPAPRNEAAVAEDAPPVRLRKRPPRRSGTRPGSRSRP
ncbi:MAG: BTAD domain-containing putative transcriptional regulator [Burkholderiales bacterium]